MAMSKSTLRNRIVDGPASIGQRMRARRWEWFRSEFPDIGSMSVIDLGGTPEAWLRAPVRPASVHVVNIEPQAAPPATEWIRADQADACNLPDRISRARYDLVFSNSVIEHVGGHAQRMRFAEAVHALSGRHWVQTPYRYFPVEPHWLFPGLQFMPLALRARLAYHWPLVHTKAGSFNDALLASMEVELISRTEMRFYFPNSDIRAERGLGLAKSLIAIKKS
jgi:hypothetical protein